jgi:hypothetical protein
MMAWLTRSFATMFAVAAVCALPRPGVACRCREPSSPEAAYKAAYAVVSGKLLALTTPAANGTVEATLQVEHAWKSPVPSAVHITTGTDCAFPFAAGESYLLFVARSADGRFTTGRCMGNRTLADAGAFITWLDRHGAREAEKHTQHSAKPD